MDSDELLAAAVSYATVAGRAVRHAHAKRGVADELAVLNAREPRAVLRLRTLYAKWPSTVLIRATAVELMRQRWDREPAAYDAVLAALNEQLSPMRAPARTVMSRRLETKRQAVEA